MRLKNKIHAPNDGLVISLAEFKEHIRWNPDDSSEDALMVSYIKAATRQAESFTDRAIQRVTYRTWVEYWDNIRLNIAPVDASTLTLSYYDVDEVLQVVDPSEYFVHDYGEDDYLEIELYNYGVMPVLFDKYDPIQIEYQAGYEVVPEPIKLAIRNKAASDFEHRTSGEAANPDRMMGFYQDLYPYKIF